MCGIIGIAGKNRRKITEKETQAMLKTLSCRGPDDTGIELFNTCLLGQTRLSIIDLSGGHQPMKDNKKKLTVTFNGEIYNYQELKKELEAKGHVFSSKSDTEVILKAYSEYGTDCPKHLDGMFAFALWDEDKQSLFVARDRFGKKPLYYCFDTFGNLCFASEIKALIAQGHVKPKLNYQALGHYLTLMYVLPTETIYENIFTLAPAESLIWKNERLTKTIYWKLEYAPLSISYADAKAETKRLLTEAVRKRMIADVEIGSFLSGGVDSTLVTHLAQSFSKNPLKTFSVGYENFINELPFAEEASKKIGTDHYTLQASGNQINELVNVVTYFDEPHGDSSNFPQHLVSKLACTKVKVVLSGDGADELFMGYGWYWKYWNLGMKEKIQHLFKNEFSLFFSNLHIFTQPELTQLLKNPTAFEIKQFDELNGLNIPHYVKTNLFDITTYLPGQLLTKVDRTSMMNSVEVRSPFLDYTLAEFAFNLPQEFKTDKKSGKIIIKDILAEIMPHEFVYRRKQGFGAPVKEWLKQPEWKKYIYSLFKDKEAITYQFLNREYVIKLIDAFYSGNDKVFYKIWLLICLELWAASHRDFIH